MSTEDKSKRTGVQEYWSTEDKSTENIFSGVKEYRGQEQRKQEYKSTGVQRKRVQRT